MPQTCSTCRHPDRKRIDAAIIEGVPNRRIASQFGMSEASVRRHADAHIPVRLALARQVEDVADADSLLDRLRALNRETSDVLKEARRASDQDLRLRAIARAEKQLELEARLLGELNETTVNIVASPEWLAIRTRLIAALAPYPEAGLAVSAALQSGEGSVRHVGH